MYCGKCGAEVIEGKRFCSDCGAMLVDTDSQQSPQAVSRDTECQNQQYQSEQPDQTTQPTENPFTYGSIQQQSIPYTQADYELKKAEKAYKRGKRLSDFVMISGLVSLGMLVFGILFWPFYFFLYVAGASALVVSFFAKRTALEYKNIEAYADGFKKNKSSVRFGKGLSIFSMVTPVVLITTVIILLIIVASQLLGHTSEIIAEIFSSGGLSGAFNRVVTLVSDLNDSGVLTKILSILSVLIRFI